MGVVGRSSGDYCRGAALAHAQALAVVEVADGATCGGDALESASVAVGVAEGGVVDDVARGVVQDVGHAIDVLGLGQLVAGRGHRIGVGGARDGLAGAVAGGVVAVLGGAAVQTGTEQPVEFVVSKALGVLALDQTVVALAVAGDAPCRVSAQGAEGTGSIAAALGVSQAVGTDQAVAVIGDGSCLAVAPQPPGDLVLSVVAEEASPWCCNHVASCVTRFKGAMQPSLASRSAPILQIRLASPHARI